jgi:hypothetical protein
MSALAQIRLVRREHADRLTLAQQNTIDRLTWEKHYLMGQVDCLVGNPARKQGDGAYQQGYAEAYAMQAQATARTEQAELPEGCF